MGRNRLAFASSDAVCRRHRLGEVKVKPLVVSPLVGEMAGRPEGVKPKLCMPPQTNLPRAYPAALRRCSHTTASRSPDGRAGEQTPSGLPAISPTRGENICGGPSLPLLRSARGIVLGMRRSSRLSSAPLWGRWPAGQRGVERQTLHAAEDDLPRGYPAAFRRCGHTTASRSPDGRAGEQTPSGLPAISPTRGEYLRRALVSTSAFCPWHRLGMRTSNRLPSAPKAMVPREDQKCICPSVLVTGMRSANKPLRVARISTGLGAE
jgi:hypothetical protein